VRHCARRAFNKKTKIHVWVGARVHVAEQHGVNSPSCDGRMRTTYIVDVDVSVPDVAVALGDERIRHCHVQPL
jgi:hypothetical protein